MIATALDTLAPPPCAQLLGWRLLKATRGTRYFMKLGSHSAKG